MKNEKTSGPSLKSGMMHDGLKSADRVPMGVELPRANMDYMRNGKINDSPTIGPRTA